LCSNAPPPTGLALPPPPYLTPSHPHNPNTLAPTTNTTRTVPPQELLEILPQLLKVEAVDDVRTLLGPQNVANYHPVTLAHQQQQQAATVAAAAAAAVAACGGCDTGSTGSSATVGAEEGAAAVVANVCVGAPAPVGVR